MLSDLVAEATSATNIVRLCRATVAELVCQVGRKSEENCTSYLS